MLCYAMLCYAMLCYAMLYYAMLCYAMLYRYVEPSTYSQYNKLVDNALHIQNIVRAARVLLHQHVIVGSSRILKGGGLKSILINLPCLSVCLCRYAFGRASTYRAETWHGGRVWRAGGNRQLVVATRQVKGHLEVKSSRNALWLPNLVSRTPDHSVVHCWGQRSCRGHLG